MSAIVFKDAIIHYEVLGHGKPVLFLHSWIGSWRYWMPSMQYASARYRAYALDFWGYGTSKKISARYTIEKQVELVKGFIEEMGANRITLVGHGLGSIIAIYFAADHPHLVDRIMLVGFPMGPQKTNLRLRSQSPADSAKWLFGERSANKPSLEDAKKTDPEAISLSFEQFGEVDWRQLIKRLDISSLWVYGKKDPAVTCPDDEQLRLLPHISQYTLFERSGHFPMLDEPGKFNRLLTDFMNLSAGEDPHSLEIKNIWQRRVR